MSHESSASSATFGNSGQGFIHVSHGAESSTSKPPRPVNQNTDEIPQVVPVGTVRPERVVSRVQQALTDYREGRIGKGYAISIFTKALDFDANGTDASKEAALQDYIQQLAAFDEDNRDSDSTHSDDEGQYEDTTRRTAEVSNPHLKAAAIENHNKNVHGRKGKGKKLARRERDDGGSSGGDSSSSDSSSDDGSDEKDKHKSKKVKLTDMPWYEEEKTAITTARPSCTKSTELLETYARDYKKVKRWLETSQVAQESFPSSEWDNIIRGKAVNLDVVLSSTFHLVAVKENVGRIGDRSISLGTTEPARKVANHGDWTIAWNRASAAVTFAFPHRQKELRAYGEFIQGEFSARVPEAHARVILFDKSIREEVGGGTRLLLTDTEAFQRQRAAILSADGLFASTSLSFDQLKGRAKATEICNRFNSSEGCPRSIATCKYRHVCKKCGRGNGHHGAAACDKSK